VTDKPEKNIQLEQLQAKIDVLEKENLQLAERAEDTLLLGLVAEEINNSDVASQIIDAGLEKISLLKNIPLCAYGLYSPDKIAISHYYFSLSNAPFPVQSLPIQKENQKKLQLGSSQLITGQHASQLYTLDFSDFHFVPDSVFLIPTVGDMQNNTAFFFAATADTHLPIQFIMLQRLVEMISARLDNVILLDRLTSINMNLDDKVQERTTELSEMNQRLTKEIQERAEVDMALHQSEYRFRSLFQDALDMIHIVDKDMKIIDANPMELATLKYTREEYIGKHLTEIIHPDNRAQIKKNFKAILWGESIEKHETALISKDGEKIDVEVNAVPHFDGDEIVSVRAISRNITMRKIAEQEMIKTKKLDSLGVLAGGIAHDFNNILAAILGNVSLALIYTENNQEAHELLKDAEKASLRAKKLTHQLLTLSKGGDPVKKVSSLSSLTAIQSLGSLLLGKYTSHWSMKCNLEAVSRRGRAQL